MVDPAKGNGRLKGGESRGLLTARFTADFRVRYRYVLPEGGEPRGLLTARFTVSFRVRTP